MYKNHNRPRIMYLRDQKKNPVGCVAIVVDRKSNEVQYQVSVRNPHDNFEKPVARHLALGRLVEMPIRLSLDVYDPTMHDVSEAVMTDIAMRSYMPTRARKAACNWLHDLIK